MKTQIIAEPGKQELFIHRESDALVNLVYKAFSDPGILVKFFTPKGIKMQFLLKDHVKVKRIVTGTPILKATCFAPSKALFRK